jgi:hypothetical protein
MIGVGVACIDGTSFSLMGFLCAGISNLCFSSRAVISKRLFAIPSTNISLDELQLFFYISVIGSCVLFPLAIFSESSSFFSILKQNYFNQSQLLLLLLMNGITYSIYNFVSFLVLSRTKLITHAVLNVFRRVVIILFTSWFFRIPFSLLNGSGIILAVFGVLMFALSKNKEMQAAVEHFNSVETMDK